MKTQFKVESAESKNSPHNNKALVIDSPSAEQRRMSDSLPTPDRLYMDPTLQHKSPADRFSQRKRSDTQEEGKVFSKGYTL